MNVFTELHTLARLLDISPTEMRFAKWVARASTLSGAHADSEGETLAVGEGEAFVAVEGRVDSYAADLNLAAAHVATRQDYSLIDGLRVSFTRDGRALSPGGASTAALDSRHVIGPVLLLFEGTTTITLTVADTDDLAEDTLGLYLHLVLSGFIVPAESAARLRDFEMRAL